MSVIRSGNDDRYVGHRRSAPDGRDELDSTAGRRRPWGASKTIQLFAILVVSVPAAIFGMQLGMSAGDGADAGGTPALVPPAFTFPVSLPSVTMIPDQTAGTQPAPGADRPTTSPQARNPGPTAYPPPVVNPAAPPAAMVLDNFDDSARWQMSFNDIDKGTSADMFANGGGNGDGVVGGGGLTLVYHDDGWFGSDVFADVSAYRYLVLRVTGAAGGEQRHFKLTLGGVERVFGDFSLDDGATPVITTSYRDIRIPMAGNGIDAKRPGELQLTFWWGGTSTIVIDEIRFE